MSGKWVGRSQTARESGLQTSDVDGEARLAESQRDEFELPRKEEAEQAMERDMFKRSAARCGNLHHRPPRASLTETT